MATIGPIPATNSASQGIGLQDFLKVLLTQLTYQDPLKPMDNQQFMAQMAQFTSLEQTQQLNARMDALLSTQATLQSVGLLGKTVDVGTTSGVTTGTVVALNLAADNPSLSLRTAAGATLDGISLSSITTVR